MTTQNGLARMQPGDDLVEVSPSAAIDPTTGELLQVEDDAPHWDGFTTSACTPDETDRLTADFDPLTEWDILPTGEVYVNHMRYRARLTDVFGAGGWGMRPLEPMRYDDETRTGYQRWALFARGQILGIACGSSEYHGSRGARGTEDRAVNRRQDLADTAEAVKSNALVRLCKDLAMGAQLYNRRAADLFRREYCVQVWRARRDGASNRPQWRRTDATPWHDETGTVDDRGPAQEPAGAAPEARPTSEASRPASRPQRAAQRPTDPVGTRRRFTGTVKEAKVYKSGTKGNGQPWSLGTVQIEGYPSIFWTFDTRFLDVASGAKTRGDGVRGEVELKDAGQGRPPSWHLTEISVDNLGDALDPAPAATTPEDAAPEDF